MLEINSTVPRDRKIISIGHNYNYQKFISFINTEDSDNKKASIPYLSNYPDQFYNVSVCHVSLSLIVSNLFGSFNEVDSHNKFI